MANRWAFNFAKQRIEQPKSGRPNKPNDGLPFTLAEEAWLELAALKVMREHEVTSDTFKKMVLAYAKKQNVYFDESLYDEWLVEYLKYHPKLWISMFPEMDPLNNDDPDARVRQMFQDEKKFRDASALPNEMMEIDDEPEETALIADINNEGKTIFRKKETTDSVHILYGNFMFNYRGYPAGIIIGQTSLPLQAFMTERLKLLEVSNLTCSFIQEVYDGLRIHSDTVFTFEGIEAANSNAAFSLKWYLRRIFKAKASLTPLVSRIHHPFTEESTTTLLNLTRKFVQCRMPLTFDPRQMLIMTFQPSRLFEATTEFERYSLDDVYQYVKTNCERLNMRYPPNNLELSKIIKKTFPLFETIRINMRGPKQKLTLNITPKYTTPELTSQ